MSIKNAILRIVSSLIIASAMAVSAPVFAYDFWDGAAGNLNGTSTLTGPVTFIYNGLAVPCTAKITVQVTNGSAKVTAASFSGSGTCAAITACSLPWNMGRPVGPSGMAGNVTITGICASVPFPGGTQTCTGTVTGTLTNSPNTFTFAGSLTTSPGPGTCTFRSTGNLTPSPALGIQ